jgi:chemotaxis signal transduction protein
MDKGTRFFIVSLGGESYAMPITRLLEIAMPQAIKKDSTLTEMFEGKFEFAGKWIPVLNIKKIFRLPGKPGTALKGFSYEEDQKIMILDFERLLHAY